jgi:hypothetical protein
VREIPDERRLKWKELPNELLVLEGLQQALGSLSRVRQNAGELSR